MSTGTSLQVGQLKFAPIPGAWVVVAREDNNHKSPLLQKLNPGFEPKIGSSVCGADDEEVIGGCASGYYNEVTHIITDQSTIEMLDSLLQFSRSGQDRERGETDDEYHCPWERFQSLLTQLVKDYRVITPEIKDFSEEIKNRR